MKKIAALGLLFIFSISLGACGESIREIDQNAPLAAIRNTPSTVYNHDIAKIAVRMSFDAEDSEEALRKTYGEYGLTTVKKANYGTRYFGGGAYSIGIAKVKEGDGSISALLVVTARGSSTTAEFIGDWLKGGSKTFLDQYKVYKNTYDFEEKVWSGLSQILRTYSKEIKNTHTRILVTGHSLGGAAADMVAARLTKGIEDGEWWSDLFDKEDIYAYTFGAISVLEDGNNVSDGFENIHNIYNYYDSYGPNGNQKWTGASSPDAKFGHTEMYCKEETESGLTSCNNHMNYREGMDEPEKAGLQTCTGIYPSADTYTQESVGDGSYYEEEEADIEEEQLDLGDWTENTMPTPEDGYSMYGFPEGTYISNDEFHQEFTFYGGNQVTLSALGISADGTYEVRDGRIIVSYEFLGEQVWSPSFSIEGDSIYIAGTEFIRE